MANPRDGAPGRPRAAGAAPRAGDSAEEPPVGVDSAGVYEGLSAEDLGYGDLPRVGGAPAPPPARRN